MNAKRREEKKAKTQKELNDLEKLERDSEILTPEELNEELKNRGFVDFERFNERMEELKEQLGIIPKEEKVEKPDAEKYHLVTIADENLTEDQKK